MCRYMVLLQLVWLTVFAAYVYAEDVVQIYYEERIPYAVTSEKGDVSGLTANPTAKAFNQTGISFQWKKMPFKRQLQSIKYNKKMACGIGWFKKPEREEFALFTNVIYQDKPSITLSKQNNTVVAQHSDVASLLKDQQLKLLVKDDFSYGSYVDALIKAHSPEKVVAVGSSNVQMLQMILSGRADYFFVSEEEAEQIITSSRHELVEFQRHRYSDMPTGNKRYIACSQQVTSATIDLLNQALGQ
jgi:polar amino acid transport system substrate-binding protein